MWLLNKANRLTYHFATVESNGVCVCAHVCVRANDRDLMTVVCAYFQNRQKQMTDINYSCIVKPLSFNQVPFDENHHQKRTKQNKVINAFFILIALGNIFIS